jgi:hypothetical protein
MLPSTRTPAGVSEHQLNDTDVDAVREQAARAFVPQVVPAEIDPLEPGSSELMAGEDCARL